MVAELWTKLSPSSSSRRKSAFDVAPNDSVCFSVIHGRGSGLESEENKKKTETTDFDNTRATLSQMISTFVCCIR